MRFSFATNKSNQISTVFWCVVIVVVVVVVVIMKIFRTQHFVLNIDGTHKKLKPELYASLSNEFHMNVSKSAKWVNNMHVECYNNRWVGRVFHGSNGSWDMDRGSF